MNILDNRHGARKRLEPPGIPDGAVPENVKRGLQEEVWDDSVFYVAGEHHWHVSTEREQSQEGLPSGKRFLAVFALERSVIRVCKVSYKCTMQQKQRTFTLMSLKILHTRVGL